MKSIFLLLIAISIEICIYGQPFGEAATNFRIIKLDYENSSGEKAVTNFKYNYYGMLTKAYWSLYNNTRSSINYYEYDENGWLISAYRDFSDGLTSFEFFTYDDFGNKISEHFYRSDSVSGSASYQYQDDLLKTAEFKNHKGWLNGTLNYQYNEKKKRKDAVLLKDDIVICYISFEYNSKNNLIKEYWNFQGKWSQTFTYYYEQKNENKNYYSNPLFSNLGKYQINKENYTFNNEIGGPSIYRYNDNGLLYSKEFIRSDSVTTNTYYEYDSKGKLIASQRYYSNGDIAKFTYDYDENNYLIFRSHYNNDTLHGIESYLYNSEGEIIKAYIKNFDNWLTGIISFNYNAFGEIEKGDFKGENGFDAMISFKYNIEGFPIEIIWEFTFGKFQKYNFEYEMKDTPWKK
ncbi:hypothetical protein ACFLTE_05270 [Bacteroidota bacterium]